ncbi:stage V sporulation protein D [Clostridium isatidis]|uniref:stage V sporulation protein D n=1 Tax=Clostridium isatidis TaxID=182773 RepID=UPI003AACACD5
MKKRNIGRKSNVNIKNNKSSNIKRQRALISSLIISSLLLFLIVRLIYVMIYKGEEYKEMAKGQWKSQVNVEARRGDIKDRNGTILATSIDVYRVDLDLDAIDIHLEDEEVTIEELAGQLSEASGVPYDEVMKKLNPEDKENRTSTLITGIEKDVADKIRELGIYGVVISISPKRYYPNNNFLAHVLGSVNSDNVGLNGIELQYDSELTGTDGYKIAEVDGSFSELPYQTIQYSSPIDGKDINLTIDENIQLIAEKVAEKGLEEHKATGVGIIVTNPNNGEILAMVNKPDFNPNTPYEDYENFKGETESEKLENMFRNNAISDSFEPGSTFKNITIAAALEEGLVTENDTFYCGGYLQFGSTKIKCWNLTGHGTQTLAEILQNSCNVGFMELGAKLGNAKMKEYIDKFGFGMATGIDLPGETEGIVKSVSDMSEMDLATIAFGQTNTASNIQIIQAFNAIANGGKLIQPHIVREITHDEINGTKVIDEEFKPAIKENVISEETANTVRLFLERTINQGPTLGAFMGEERRVGGKTGTAQKPDLINGGYSPDKYIASIVALYPVEKPEMTIFIKVEDPSTGIYYGGQVATPLAKELLSELFVYMDSQVYKERYTEKDKVVVPEVRGKSIKEAEAILKENNLKIEIESNNSKVVNMAPYPGALVEAGSLVIVNVEDITKDISKIIMPNLVGKTLEEATQILNKIGIEEYKINGEGIVSSQSVIAGKLIDKKTTVKLDLKS